MPAGEEAVVVEVLNHLLEESVVPQVQEDVVLIQAQEEVIHFLWEVR